MSFRWPFSPTRSEPACVPPGARVYAIGDVHGETTLFAALLAMIEQDSVERGPADTSIIILGDFIDRGPRSADLVAALMRADDDRLTVLKGNHEAALVDGYRGDKRALEFWLKHGGRATLASYGCDVDTAVVGSNDPADLIAIIQRVISAEIIDWLDQLPLYVEVGDYFFVHAGVRPGIDLGRQSVNDLLWIRDPFLSSRRDHGKVIVHGHTVAPGDVVLGGRRIGVDTGAYQTGRLTALALEDHRQWIIEATVPGDGAHRPPRGIDLARQAMSGVG